MTSENSLGSRLIEARNDSDLSQADVAELVGVAVSALEGWESNERSPRSNRLSMLAGILNVTLRWLLTGEGPKNRPTPGRITDDEVADALTAIRAQLDSALNQLDALTSRLDA